MSCSREEKIKKYEYVYIRMDSSELTSQSRYRMWLCELCDTGKVAPPLYDRARNSTKLTEVIAILSPRSPFPSGSHRYIVFFLYIISIEVYLFRSRAPPKISFTQNSVVQPQMACLNTLKQEIKTLESVFPKSHERFQIMSASVDELSCRFVGKNGKKYEIHANITVSQQDHKPHNNCVCVVY